MHGLERQELNRLTSDIERTGRGRETPSDQRHHSHRDENETVEAGTPTRW